MTKSNRNSGKQWSKSEVKDLKQLADQNTPTRVISLKLGRTENAVYSKASDQSIYLNAFETGSEARAGIDWWIEYYNTRRPHSTFDGATPNEVYNGDWQKNLAT